jgi:hypothetical protein
MPDPFLTCQYVDVALVMQQMIRERETAKIGAPATVAIGDACGKPAIGSVPDDDGSRHHFCADHVLEERVLRD